jgi:hypothetical protein
MSTESPIPIPTHIIDTEPSPYPSLSYNVIRTLNDSLLGLNELQNNNIDVGNIKSIDAHVLNYQQAPKCKGSLYTKFHPVIRECRNLVVKKLDQNNWIVVSRSFRRFFNINDHQEETKLILDGIAKNDESVVAYEKLDGSLITVTHFAGKWRIFTRGSDATVNAFRGTAIDYDEKETFGDKVTKLLNMDALNPRHTYVFELCHPGSHVTVYDHSFLSLLTVINKSSDEEFMSDDILDVVAKKLGVERPEYFCPKSIDEVYERIKTKPLGFEGYVLRHLATNTRVKVKSDTYLIASHTKLKSVQSYELIKIIIKGENDEFEKIFSDQSTNDKMKQIYDIVEREFTRAETLYDKFAHLPRKEFAQALNDATSETPSPLKHILFDIKTGNVKREHLRCPWVGRPSSEDAIIDKLTKNFDELTLTEIKQVERIAREAKRQQAIAYSLKKKEEESN